jgi:thiosulfate dehydrogenase
MQGCPPIRRSLGLYSSTTTITTTTTTTTTITMGSVLASASVDLMSPRITWRPRIATGRGAGGIGTGTIGCAGGLEFAIDLQSTSGALRVKSVLKGLLLGIAATLVVLAAAGYAVLRAGIIPANADAKPGRFERYIAGTSLKATLQKEAPKEQNPISLNDANLIAGAHLYGSHCAVCHGTAGKDAPPPPIAKGEYPQPPQLAKHGVEDDPQGWTYWKIKHGIRWTGMPSWKDELTDRQIWTLTLFLKHMDKLPLAAAQAWQGVGVSAPR